MSCGGDHLGFLIRNKEKSTFCKRGHSRTFQSSLLSNGSVTSEKKNFINIFPQMALLIKLCPFIPFKQIK